MSDNEKNLSFLLTLQTDKDWSDFSKHLVDTYGIHEAIKELQYGVSLLIDYEIDCEEEITDLTEANLLLEKFK